ncbi:MAG: mechanosensitive ion channel family protein [Pseudomonadota bacterium]
MPCHPMTALRGLLATVFLILGLVLGSGSALAQEADGDAGPALPAPLLNAGIDPEELDHRLVPLTRPELAALAAEWQAIVKAKTEEVMEAQISVMNSAGEEADAARATLTELANARKALFTKYTKVVNAWEKKGGDEALIAEFRAYRSSIIVEETRTADVQTLMAEAMSWATNRDGGLQLAIDLGVTLVSIIGLLFVARIVRGFLRRWIGRVPNLSKLLQAFLVTVVYWVVMAIGLMVVLSALGIDVSPVFALIGGASFILAFAFQDTLGNLASGLMIMVNRPFDEGDYVDVGGVAGTVKSVSIVATTVVTPDNQIIVIPNKNVWGNVITNVTASDTRRVDLIFGISYEDSIPEALRVMEETVAAHPLVLADPAPMIRVHELADSSVNFICRPWSKTSDYWTLYWDLMRQMKENFDAAGISIPYPQQDVHMHPVSAAPVARTGAEPAPAPRAADGDFAAQDDGHGAEAIDR